MHQVKRSVVLALAHSLKDLNGVAAVHEHTNMWKIVFEHCAQHNSQGPCGSDVLGRLITVRNDTDLGGKNADSSIE